MITQEATYYDDYTIKTISEYNEGVLVSYREHDEQGRVLLHNDIDGNIIKFEYDKKNRLKRTYQLHPNGNIEWKTFSYPKENMVVLHRRLGNPSIIRKMWFGPEENGSRELIMEKFL